MCVLVLLSVLVYVCVAVYVFLGVAKCPHTAICVCLGVAKVFSRGAL